MHQPDLFQNLTHKKMGFSEVFSHILTFMKREPVGNYRLMVGTDSQVHPSRTLFITGVVIQRVGKGAWACYRKEVIPREMTTLHERISYETSLTERVASLFTEERKNELIDIVLPHIYKGATFTMEGHIDIGSGDRNRTKGVRERNGGQDRIPWDGTENQTRFDRCQQLCEPIYQIASHKFI